MKRTGTLFKTNAQRYALAGALFGLVFPVIATLIRILEAGLPLNFSSMLAVHLTDPLLWIIDTAPVFLGFFAYLAGRRQDALENTNQLLRSREQELEAAQAAMEQQVRERTQELASKNQIISERAEYLTSVIDTFRSLLAAQDLDRLLIIAAQEISRQFKYDHVGIYLLDEQKQHALLLASSSKGEGQSGHQPRQYLRMGEQNLVEFAIRSGQTNFVNDNQADPFFKQNPERPNTRSELVLPLKSGQTVIGALDLQSDTPSVFTEEYISVLAILADLVAIAIQNSALNEKTQRTLREVEATSRQISSRAWEGWLEPIKTKGYRYDGIKAEPVKEVDASSSASSKVQSIPVRLRGRTIGNLKIKLSEASQAWTDDDHTIAEAAAERAALALEGARLLEEAKKRATREAFLSEMATKLSTSFRLDSILRDTVEELGRTLEGSTVSFQLINPATPPDFDSRTLNVPPAPSQDAERGNVE